MKTFQAICQVCGEKIIWIEELHIKQWVHESNKQHKKDGHFAFVREESMIALELFEPKPEGSEVAFW